MPPRRPRKELTSKVLQNSLRANILPLIKGDLRGLACRASWRVKEEDLERAKNQIASKRLELDDLLSKIFGIQFFISSLTAVSTNSKGARAGNERESKIYPAISFFLVYRETESCDQSKIYQVLHNEDMSLTVHGITTRVKEATNREMEQYARQLFQVVKDHNCDLVKEMLNSSNKYCLANCARSASAEESDESNAGNQRPRYATSPCRLVVVNVREFNDSLHDAITRLRSDGMSIEFEASCTAQDGEVCFASTTDELTSTIRQIAAIMTICKHALHRGDVYAMPEQATMAYVKMMDITSYLNKLLTNQPVRRNVLKHFASLQRILSHRACEIIRQVEFDLDLIEVSNGFFFQISSRNFIRDAIPREKYSIISPRAFLPYDCEKQPQPGYFREGVLNSFPELHIRANFCNKFYQCLMASKMPHKVRKLVVAGPKDSGKTSWASIFHRIITPGKMASITAERQFSAAMINDETQLVFVDEWSETTLESDLAKTILQGGWMVTAVKHGLPKILMNNSPFYITTNKVPDFGDDDENVKRRIAVFETTSLPETIPGVDKWMYDHAMDCVAWLSNEINTLREHIDPEELWYEPGNAEEQIIENNEGLKLFRNVIMANITSEDLNETNISNREQVQLSNRRQPIHRSFEVEFRRQRLARKRQNRSISAFLSSEQSDSDVERDVNHDPLSETPLFVNHEQDLRIVNRLHTSADEEHQTKSIFDELLSEHRRCLNKTRKIGSTVSRHESSNVRSKIAEEAQSHSGEQTAPANNEMTDKSQQGTNGQCENGSAIMIEIPQQSQLHSPDKSSPANNENTDEYHRENNKQSLDDDLETTENVQVYNKHDNKEDDAQHQESQESDVPSSPRIAPQTAWVLNDKLYHRKVVELWEWDFDHEKLSRVHAASFSARREKAERRRERTEREFWTKADPEIDAWMLVTGKCREVFDINAFVKRQGKCYAILQHVRRKVAVKVTDDRCPVLLAMQKLKRSGKDGQQETKNQKEEETNSRVQLSSQTYWTTIRNWRPW